MSSETNPYAPPQARLDAFMEEAQLARDVGPWRDGDIVVIRRDVAFPRRCVKCNAPVPGREMKTRTFYWHSPALYLLILLNLVIYAIVATFARKRSRHMVGLCAVHARRHRIFVAIGLSSIAMPVLGVAMFDEAGLVPGFLAAALFAIVGIFGSKLMAARRIDEREARFAGCGRAFVDSLPPLR